MDSVNFIFDLDNSQIHVIDRKEVFTFPSDFVFTEDCPYEEQHRHILEAISRVNRKQVSK